MKKLTVIAAALLLAANAYAGDIVPQPDQTQGRSQHSFIYQDDCRSCHANNPQQFVDDSACRDCHGQMSEIAIPEDRLTFSEADPHQSPHYGEGAQCIACHSEHEPSAPVCQECHRAWFDQR
ncbi:cytochrome c3 family protein [uncultured Ferrimonas sp.]|uniref:cytochrome c3 family protein n=1 Tax=uncultured Ferrimonas sp. TaxID=432640 RepID=UPI00261F87B4|nr:cytochrome c3 family protein [uncultured Ferrimonas sp.]